MGYARSSRVVSGLRRTCVNLPDPAFEALLEHVKASRGFDFTGYKRSSLIRRVNRRMAQVDPKALRQAQ